MCSSVQTCADLGLVSGHQCWCGKILRLRSIGHTSNELFLAKSRHYQCFSRFYSFVETVKADRLGNFNVSFNVPSLGIFRFCFILAPLINFIKALN